MPDLTISLTNAQAVRLATHVGRVAELTDGQGAPRAATPSEVLDYVRASLRTAVLRSERRVAAAAVAPEEF